MGDSDEEIVVGLFVDLFPFTGFQCCVGSMNVTTPTLAPSMRAGLGWEGYLWIRMRMPNFFSV
jgi:hypothetical protein